MKRILILTILLMSSLAWAGSTTVVVGQGGGGEPSCIGCSTSNDSIQTESGVTQTFDATGVRTAWQFTLASTTCVTGLYVNCSNAGSEEETAYIYTNSSNAPGTAVDGCSCTIQTGTSKADVFGAFASTVTLSAGTYWVVFTASTPNNCATGADSSGTGAHMYYDGGWQDADQAGYYWRMGVYGCTPE